MLKIYGSPICKPLEISKQCIDFDVFSSEWKKSNIVLIHKKEDKQTLENYHPVSLLPLCEKCLKDYCLTKCSTSSLKINLFHQISPVLNRVILALISCYLPLMRIYKSFDVWLEVRSVFLAISKAFDKVWHDGIIYKLTQNRISGNLLTILEDFLKERKQRTVLNERVSNCENINVGVPLGSILGPLLFFDLH